jgi:hypothetical protein
MDRFSPYFRDAETSGFRNVEPFPSYGYVFPLSRQGLREVAYHFAFDYSDGREPASYTEGLGLAVQRWNAVHRRAALYYVDDGESLALIDLRSEVASVLVLIELDRTVYLLCDRGRSLAQVKRLVASARTRRIESRVAPALRGLVRRGLLVHMDNRYLALAIRWGTATPTPSVAARLSGVSEQLRRRPLMLAPGLGEALARELG